MTLDSHLDQLKQKHQNLELQLEDAKKHPSVSDQEIAEIKRQKLLLKEKIDGVSH